LFVFFSEGVLCVKQGEVIKGGGVWPWVVEEKLNVEDGRWKMEDGRWKMEDGRWKMEDGRWKVEGGIWRNMEKGDVGVKCGGGI
jgi:hypothetical protein